ncbi:MAG: flavodoxin family protein [Candidatus Hermodarchaeia archaeon]
MVSIPVLVASPQGEKSETHEFLNETFEELNRGGFRTKTIFTPSMSFAACGGCFACETNDECIVKDDVQTFQESLLMAPGFILATPVYLMGPPGRLKCLLDRFWPWTLRPRLFGKYAGILTIAASFGALDVSRYLNAILESWGYGVVSTATALLKTRDAASKRKKRLVDSRLLGKRLAEAIEKKKQVGLSPEGKRYVSNIWGMIRDNQDEFALTYKYWQENDIAKKFRI